MVQAGGGVQGMRKEELTDRTGAVEDGELSRKSEDIARRNDKYAKREEEARGALWSILERKVKRSFWRKGNSSMFRPRAVTNMQDCQLVLRHLPFESVSRRGRQR